MVLPSLVRCQNPTALCRRTAIVVHAYVLGRKPVSICIEFLWIYVAVAGPHPDRDGIAQHHLQIRPAMYELTSILSLS